jgi:hypothetical protein
VKAAQIIETMKYLGYRTHEEDGTPNPAVEATAKALEGRTIESVMLPAFIGEEYAKHAPQRWKVDPSVDIKYCSFCGVAFCNNPRHPK